MIPLLARDIAQTLGRDWPARLDAVAVTGISIDSRSIEPGDLFVALHGTRADGRTFIPAALEAGASAVIAEAGGPYPDRVIVVENPIEALAHIASLVRAQFEGPVIGVGGSAGKTTAKEMLAALLGARYRVIASEKSFNNHLGVPLTICRAEADTEVLVTELGTNHPGELRPLAELARPTIAVLTSIGAEHLEGFVDIEGVLAEEMEVVRALPEGGTVFINADNPHLDAASYPAHVRVVRCGFGPQPLDVRGEVVEIPGVVAIRLSADGPVLRTGLSFGVLRHSLLLAAAIATRLGVTEHELAARALELRAAPLRGEVRRIGEATVVVDCYNANPLSAAAALDELRARSGRKAAILGDMLELGAAAVDAHVELGRLAAGCGLGEVLFVGRHGTDFARGFGTAGRLVLRRNALDAQPDATRLFDAGGTVLVKASRGIGLERLLEMELAHG